MKKTLAISLTLIILTIGISNIVQAKELVDITEQRYQKLISHLNYNQVRLKNMCLSSDVVKTYSNKICGNNKEGCNAFLRARYRDWCSQVSRTSIRDFNSRVNFDLMRQYMDRHDLNLLRSRHEASTTIETTTSTTSTTTSTTTSIADNNDFRIDFNKYFPKKM